MRNKQKVLILGFGFVCLFFFNILSASTLLTQEEALKEMFPNVDEIVTEVITPSADVIAQIKNELGGSLVHVQSGSQSEAVDESTQFTFYYGLKNGEKIGVAIIDTQPGKWGPVQYIICLDPKVGYVQNLAVMSYKEKRGRPIARKSFLKQFIKKNIGDPIKVRKDIRAISGATISSDATCFAVKKVIAIFKYAVLDSKVAVLDSK